LPSEKPLQRLEDILDNIERIERFTAGKDFETFAGDEQALYASLYALLVVSEAAKKLEGQAETLVPGQPWADIRSIGNVLRHDYDGVDPEAIWRVIRTGDLASLKQAVGEAVARLRAEEEP
jgi:uncharacterized protein with HEPN domain